MITGCVIFFAGCLTGGGLVWLGMFLAQDFKYKSFYGMPVKEGGNEAPKETEAETEEGSLLVPWHSDYK